MRRYGGGMLYAALPLHMQRCCISGYVMTVCCNRGGGDLLGQLHALSEAESKLSVHQRRLSEIEAKVDYEHTFFQNNMKSFSWGRHL